VSLIFLQISSTKAIVPSFFSFSTSNSLLLISSHLMLSFSIFISLDSSSYIILVSCIPTHFPRFSLKIPRMVFHHFHMGPRSFSPQWMTISWPPRLLCFTRHDRPAASPDATSKVAWRYHVPSALGRTSLRLVPDCSCVPRIHITRTGFG
jgi:hypothetical protein